METKRSFKCFLVALASICHLSSVAKADNRTTEDGTLPTRTCAEYSDLFSEFAGRLKEAVKGGLYRASLSEEDEKALIDSFAERLKNFHCIPVEKLDRDVHTNPATSVSLVLTSEWEKKSDTKKKRLVAHQVCKLLALEGEGDSDVSITLMGLWKN